MRNCEIFLDEITVQKNDHIILQEISHNFEPFGWTGIIGPNGSGKSTLLRALLGYEKFDGNLKIEISGQGAIHKNKIAYIPQIPIYPEDMSVLEYIQLGQIQKFTLPINRNNNPTLIQSILMQLELENIAQHPLSWLSGGELQRVLLARVMAQEPELLLLDEPTSALDIHFQMQILNLLKKLSMNGLRIITVMHDLTSAAQFCNDLILLDSGKIVKYGTPKQVLFSQELNLAFHDSTQIQEMADGTLIVFGKK